MMVLLRVRGERLAPLLCYGGASRRDKRMAEASPATLGRPLHSARYGLLHARQDELRQDQHADGKPFPRQLAAATTADGSVGQVAR